MKNNKEKKRVKRYWRDIKKLEAKCSKCKTCGKQLHSPTATHCNKCKPLPRGDKHWNWRGGTIGAAWGYKQVYIGRINSKTQYRLEHHLVLEKKLGRPLKPNEIGHHLNGIKTDNRPENLVAILRNKHSVWTLVELAQARIRQLEQLHLL